MHTFQVITYTPVQERHARFTVGPGSGGDHAQDLISNLAWHSRRFWSIPDPCFIPLGQQMPKATFLQGSHIQGWQDQSHIAWHSKRHGGGKPLVSKACGASLRWIQPHSARLTTLPACLSLSWISQRDGILSFSFLLLPGTSNQEQRMKEKCGGGE